MFNIKYNDLKKANAKSPLHFFYDATLGYRLFFAYEFVVAFVLTLFTLLGTIYSAKLIGYFSSISVDEFEWSNALFYVLIIRKYNFLIMIYNTHKCVVHFL